MSDREKGVTTSKLEVLARVSRRTTLRMLGTALASTPLAAAIGCDRSASVGSGDSNSSGSMQPTAAAPGSGLPVSPMAGSSMTNTAQAGTGQASTPSSSPTAGAAKPASTNTPIAGQSSTAMQMSAGQGSAGQAAGSMAAAGQSGASAAGAGGAAAQVDGWAKGGTAVIVSSSYPSPFGNQIDASCVRTEPMTLGPCHDNQAPEREDISEGRPGLPVRFGLRVVNEKCEPIANANVDVWHCDTAGVYSSETSDFASYCTGNKTEAQKPRWFRGFRQVDETGTAWFNTCFPGWYPSRALHFHVTVRRSSRQGMEALTTQLGFDPKLGDEICTTHPDYKDHGKPDTPNMTDNTFVGTSYTVETKRMPDGVMMVWKTLVIPS